MPEKEPETPANTDINQTDVQMQSQPPVPNVQHEFQPDKQSPIDEETKFHVETGSAQEAEYIRYELTAVNQTSDEDVLYSREDHERLFLDIEQKSNVKTITGGSQDSGNTACYPSRVHCDKVSDITESRSLSERQHKNIDASVTADQTERPPFEKECKSNIQKETDNVEVTGSGSIGSSNVIDGQSCGIGKDDSYTKDSFQVELPNPLTTEQPKTQVRSGIPLTQYDERESHKSPCLRYIKDTEEVQKLEEGFYESSDNGSESLQPPYVQNESRSGTRPISTVLKSEVNQPTRVHFVKSTSMNPSGGYHENRNIFEAGGEESLNPRLNHPSGIFSFGEDEIENLPNEAPEDQVFINPAVSDESETRSSLMARLRAILPSFISSCTSSCISSCKSSCKYFCDKQIPRNPFFYIISTIAFFVSLATFSSKNEKDEPDKDVPLCSMIYVAASIVISFMFENGQCSKHSEKLKETTCFGLLDKDTKKLNCCACCCRSEPEVVRCSQYRHLEDEMDLAFEHEVEDVSNIDPSNYPKIRMVEQKEVSDSGSPDYPPEITQVTADVHVPGTSNSGAISKHRGKYFPSNKTESSSSASLKFPKTVKVDVHVPQTVINPKGQRYTRGDRGQAVTSGYSESSDSVSETAEDNGEFICEHYGQGVACSCGSYRPKRKDKFKSELKIRPKQTKPLPQDAVVDIDPPGTSMNPLGISSRERRCKTNESKHAHLPSKNTTHESKRKMKKLSEQLHGLTQTVYVDVHASETSEDLKNISCGEHHAQNIEDASSPEEFICEHYGQSVACSCAVSEKKKKKREKEQ